jgi:hypothetical protein
VQYGSVEQTVTAVVQARRGLTARAGVAKRRVANGGRRELVGRASLPASRGEARAVSQQMIHLAKSQLTVLAKIRLILVNAPMIAVGTLIAVAVGMFRPRNNP